MSRNWVQESDAAVLEHLGTGDADGFGGFCRSRERPDVERFPLLAHNFAGCSESTIPLDNPSPVPGPWSALRDCDVGIVGNSSAGSNMVDIDAQPRVTQVAKDEGLFRKLPSSQNPCYSMSRHVVTFLGPGLLRADGPISILGFWTTPNKAPGIRVGIDVLLESGGVKAISADEWLRPAVLASAGIVMTSSQRGAPKQGYGSALAGANPSTLHAVKGAHRVQPKHLPANVDSLRYSYLQYGATLQDVSKESQWD